MESYEEKLAAWKRAQGVPDAIASNEDIPAGELRMIAEDAKSTGKDYCWMCGDEFPIREMVIDTSPYNQMEDDAIEEDGYIRREARNRVCKPCVKREEDELNGVEEGQEPTG